MCMPAPGRIMALLDDFELIDPGMAWIPRWRPDDAATPAGTGPFAAPNHAVVWAGVGRKP